MRVDSWVSRRVRRSKGLGAQRSLTTAALLAVAASAMTSVVGHGPSAAVGRQQQHACYPGQFTPFRARKVAITDSVVRKVSVTVRRPLDVCAPAVVDGARSIDPSLYLTCYEATATGVVGRSLGTVSNAFGAVRVSVASPRALCTSSSRTSRPPLPVRFTCYSVTSPVTAKRADSTVGDTFGTARDSVLVGRPVRFCTEPTRAAPQHLMCYTVSSETPGRTVVVTDEWGVLRGSLGRRDRLCLQSSLRP